jgi:hypothetical protein
MVSYTHVAYVIFYFYYMFLNVHLYMHIILLRTGGGTYGTVLHTVRGVGELGIRTFRFDTETSLYTEDLGLRSSDGPGACLHTTYIQMFL